MTQRDETDAQVNLANIVFDENNEERQSWEFFGRKVSRSAGVFLFQCTVVFCLLTCAIVRIICSKSCEETTVWVAISSSLIGYVIPSPKLQ